MIALIIETTRFGRFEYEESSIITFQNGIPGFKNLVKYILVAIEESPFNYLQSIEDGSVTFIVVSPFEFLDYMNLIYRSILNLIWTFMLNKK